MYRCLLMAGAIGLIFIFGGAYWEITFHRT
jgi:hypothetical protein